MATPAAPYYSYRKFLEDRYGAPAYRVPLDLEFGCPHRDPVTGAGGCAYCADNASRAPHITPGMPLEKQVERGVEFARKRYGARLFMAYFQAATSTHAPVAQIREAVERVLTANSFRTAIFSTRPDCLPDPVLDFLAELSQKIEVWVELGIQTANDRTLHLINRGHDFDCAAAAANALAARNIHVAAHLVLGLPGESATDFRNTAASLVRLPLEGVKLHNLHVVRETVLADWWENGEVDTMNEAEYAEVLVDFLRRMPSLWPVMRLVTDTPEQTLLAPKWEMTKSQFIEYVKCEMRRRGCCQGDLLARQRGE